MLLKRDLNISNLLKKKSFFLFGLRGSGKSSLIQLQLAERIPVINLLRTELYLELSAKPFKFEGIIDAMGQSPIIVIDEIQRVPELLNEVHRLIEERHLTFLLTGSSARKLKREGVNLLAGRAWQANLYPLTSNEIPQFNLERYLRFGGLPPVYLSEEPEEELIAYADTYLKEEIQAESLVRKLSAFTQFLQVAAVTSGQIINFAAVANDTGVPASTIREYYQILEDTFVGFFVPAWTKSLKRKPVSKAKFYFSDLGIKNTLAALKSIPKNTDVYGQAFEQFIALELRAYLSYRRIHKNLSYWSSKHGSEVDFIIGDEVAIEVKSSEKIHRKHLKGLQQLAEEGLVSQFFVVSHDPIERYEDNILIMPWQRFLQKLWQDEFQF